VLLDEVGLEEQRLRLRADDDGVDISNAAEHLDVLERCRRIDGEVPAHPCPQGLCFADIEDFARGVLEEIDARPRGQSAQLCFDVCPAYHLLIPLTAAAP
jgi:hypothetical protein